MKLRIYHNPRCSKSRATLALLQERGYEPEIVEYLKTPPDAGELDEILHMLGMEPDELMRKQEAPYQDLQVLEDRGDTRRAMIRAMVEHPVLIERPIVIADGKAAIGRPPEAVLDILPE